MNFEVIDNIFQLTVLLLMALLSLGMALRHQKREFLILSLSYLCFSMGTLYFVLYLALYGTPPQIFYVSEISWLASYLFSLSLLILRSETAKICFSWKAALCAAISAAASLLFQIFGPAWLMMLLFALTVGAIAYISVFRLEMLRTHSLLDAAQLVCVLLQISLYGVSLFFRDYTHFNFYFVVDLTLTACLVSLLPLLHREVTHDLH